jgi:hypothetical protein
MLEDVRDNMGFEPGSVNQTIVLMALSSEPIPELLLASGAPDIVWLATRFRTLPLCSKSPWEEIKLARDLLLLRGGLQQAEWIGFRNFG